MKYDFLALCLIMSVFTLPLLILRRDLRPAMLFTALLALPFAFTEPLFFPSYWEPTFLLGLGKKLGFGIEDFLFVMILGVLGSGLWPLVSGFYLARQPKQTAKLKSTLIVLSLFSAGIVILFLLLNIHALYAAYSAMLLFTAFVCIRRPALIAHAAGGALTLLIAYSSACKSLELLYDGIFREVWHTSGFIGTFVLGIPIEECIYALLAGATAAVLYPFMTGRHYAKLKNNSNNSERDNMKLRICAWLQASRLPSQSYIFLPLLLGQLIWLNQNGSWDWGVFCLIHMFGLFDQLYIVYANDYMDVEIDRKNTTYNIFSGGSRVLIDGTISRKSLGQAAIYAALLCVAVSLMLVLGYGRIWSLPLTLAAILLLLAYSFPPIKLSYRGGGELLQMIGVGILLPCFAYYGQAGSMKSFPWEIMGPLLPVQLGCAMSTALPDYPSDKIGGKRTFAVMLDPARTKLLIGLLYFVGLALFLALRGSEHRFDGSYLYSAVMFLLLAALIYIRDGEPGTRRMNQFVTGSVVFNLSFVVMLMFFR